MAITKTDFINYSRCKRYVALDNLNKEKLNSDITFEEYKEIEENAKIEELLSSMYDLEGNDLLEGKNEQLEVMMPYYNQIEIEAGNLASRYFKGSFKFAYNTQDQESFDCVINNIRYICYVDIYNEVDDYFNIIEVKATSSKKFLALSGKKDGIKNPIFKKKNGIYYLLEDLNLNVNDYMSINEYNKSKDKLFDRYSSCGHYIYDIAVQRYIIENDLKQNNEYDKIDNIKYYLAVLNDSYIFDGTYKNNEAIYNTDINGNDIISYFDVTSITKDYLDLIDLDRKNIEKYINELNGDRCDIGEFCEYKKTTHCKFCKLCFNNIKEKNSIFTYLDNHCGFKDELGNSYKTYDLINSGMVDMEDVPKEYLNREKNRIQRKVVETHEAYFNKSKIKDGIDVIKYPIYHLDFETFPCPLPRFYGERPYTQSVFQFSLHIEKEDGICDKVKDHYGYLAIDNFDHRKELIEEMIKYINTDGTVLVYNESFEKSRLSELATIFPQYKTELLRIRDMVFDLLNITKTKTSLYESLGYSKEEASLFNYYHEDLNGSYSIKKFLPLFSNLTYKGMEVSNGVEALVTYAKFPMMDKIEYEHKYNKLVEYCRQDTWAMVEILKGLKESVK